MALLKNMEDILPLYPVAGRCGQVSLGRSYAGRYGVAPVNLIDPTIPTL